MAATTDLNTYKFNHSMIRVKDPKESGRHFMRKLPIDREGVIELTHNYGTENDPTYTINNGNKDPHRGFGHTCISVDNIQAACQRIEDAGYKFQKKLTEGRMNHIAFALDPDGYWVEVIGQKPIEETASIKETDNHTMIRVKDPQKSLKFYQEVLGMSLFRTSEAPSAGFNLYFLGYPGTQGAPQDGKTSDREGLLELTWNYGTEKDESFSYHNGNSEPQGFGHICVSVDDLDAACQRFEDLKCNWKKRLTDGRMHNVAFLLDPDGYWVEVVQNDRFSDNSAELSEAINSMFHWYRQAEVCITYLDDFPFAKDETTVGPEIEQCRWFFRGWTLQELIAPPELRFYSKEWNFIGTRTSLKAVIAKVSRIPEVMLEADMNGRGRRLEDFSVAEKMSWAANRKTTRPEDMAYCLLGLFDINMPLLYGEGRAKAFKRLQEEIIRSTNDDSIYAWSYSKGQSMKQHFWGLLADSPSAFGQYRESFVIKPARYLARRSNHVATVSNRGLNVELAIAPVPGDKSGTIFIAVLDCDMMQYPSEVCTPAILLQKTSWHSESEFVRIRPDYLLVMMENYIMTPEDDQDGSLQPKELPPVDVLWQSGEWMYFNEVLPTVKAAVSLGGLRFDLPDDSSAYDKKELYVLNFDYSSDLGVTEPTMAKMLGSLELKIPHNYDYWKVCLITGLEPLPPNPFGTPSLYTVPWYAFETKNKVMAGMLDNVLNKERRRGWFSPGAAKKFLVAKFDLESRHSRLFYRVVLQMEDTR
ncbi:hypothetical protein TrVFT333_007418 [Trichoderma virens FT-333]|nr:hypothetical protein TrVFT333_007418 [Trichoderma virens FT-333]